MYIIHHTTETQREKDKKWFKVSWVRSRRANWKRSVCIPWCCRDGCHGYPFLCKAAGILRHRPHHPCRLSSAGESKTCCLSDWGGRAETGVRSDQMFILWHLWGKTLSNDLLMMKWVRTHSFNIDNNTGLSSPSANALFWHSFRAVV